jgi:hypothetical protein
MEGSFERSKVSYKSKIPDIEQTLELIKIMKKKAENDDEMFTNYSLCDTIYAKAKVRGFGFNFFLRTLQHSKVAILLRFLPIEG